jgi:adenylate kinase
MERFDAIIFIGPQGSGKGTQATILAAELGAEYVEAGMLLRKVAKEDTDFGKHIKKLIEAGSLVSDEELLQVINSRLRSLDPNVAVIFDGMPRKMKQAEILLEFLREHGRKKIATLYVTMPRPLTIQRLQSRLICIRCEHPEIANGEPDQRCSVCEGQLMHRTDDTAEAIHHRLDNYEKETLPVVDYLKSETKFFHIDGSGYIPVVTAQICNALDLPIPEYQPGTDII